MALNWSMMPRTLRSYGKPSSSKLYPYYSFIVILNLYPYPLLTLLLPLTPLPYSAPSSNSISPSHSHHVFSRSAFAYSALLSPPKLKHDGDHITRLRAHGSPNTNLHPQHPTSTFDGTQRSVRQSEIGVACAGPGCTGR